jgi:hypothetical protein
MPVHMHVLSASYSYEIPKVSKAIHFDNGFGQRVLDDWRLAGVYTYFSGAPYSPSFSIQQSTSTTNVSLGNIFLGTGDLTPRLLVTGSPNSGGAPLYYDATGLGLPRTRLDWNRSAQFPRRTRKLHE